MNQCGHRDFTVESTREVVQSGLRSQTGLNSSSTAVEMRTMFGCKGQESPNNRGLNQLDVHFSFLYKLRGGYFKSAAFTWFCGVLRTQAPPTWWVCCLWPRLPQSSGWRSTSREEERREGSCISRFLLTFCYPQFIPMDTASFNKSWRT